MCTDVFIRRYNCKLIGDFNYGFSRHIYYHNLYMFVDCKTSIMVHSEADLHFTEGGRRKGNTLFFCFDPEAPMAMAFVLEADSFFCFDPEAPPPAMAFFTGTCFFFDAEVAPLVVLFTEADPLFPVSGGAPEAPFFPAAAALVLVATEATNFLSPASEVATFSVGPGAPSESEEE